MTERITTLTDERMAGYSRVLEKALKFEQDIKKNMREGKGTIYFTIDDKRASRGNDLEIGHDLLPMAKGAAFGAYRELAYVAIFVKATGEVIRAINPDGKAIADKIISDMLRQDRPKE